MFPPIYIQHEQCPCRRLLFDELCYCCGHKLRDRDAHCKSSKVIWPCHANRNKHAGKVESPPQVLPHTNFKTETIHTHFNIKSRFTTVRPAALLYCWCSSSGLVGGWWVGGGCTTWVNCFALWGGGWVGRPYKNFPSLSSRLTHEH